MAIVLKDFQNLNAAVTDILALKPAVRGQNRLEGYPRSEDFSRALRAEVRDPLWFLTRQWQFGEFKGDDAGSPIDARIKLTKRQLSTFKPGNGEFGPLPNDLPLETVVEREPVPTDYVTLRQIASAVRRGLQGQGVSTAQIGKIMAAYRDAYPLDPETIDGVADTAAARIAPMALAQLFDGIAYLGDVAAGAHDGKIDAAPVLSAGGRTAAKTVAPKVAEFHAALYSQPDAGLPGSWNPEQIEYQFEAETAPGALGDRLRAAEYVSGRLDWPAFDYTRARQIRAAPDETTQIESFVPAAVTFGGMPNPRFWMMEDRHVEFADITAGTTDAGKLLLTEFALAYANDWVMFPIEVEVGALCDVEGVLVRDVFGEASLVRAVGRGTDDDWQRWSMFGLSTHKTAADRRLFLPPATPRLMEPEPVERVALLRDEMANMTWGVERLVPSQAGHGRSGSALADAAADPPPPDRSGDAVRYRLGTEPPLNWIPFVPVHVPGSNRDIRMQRARLPGGNRELKGRILAEPGPYFVNEEEFPRAGKIVTRGFQRCRWTDGRIVQWVGRRVRVGQGEGSSGMIFDTID